MISRRAQGPTRGQILLNGVPMSMRLFQESCGYVTQKCDLLDGLSVEATLMYAASISLGRKVQPGQPQCGNAYGLRPAGLPHRLLTLGLFLLS